jgi:hypothetical protein
MFSSGDALVGSLAYLRFSFTLDAAVLNYDSPYRLRLGAARPVQGRAYTDSPNGSVYFSLGLSF